MSNACIDPSEKDIAKFMQLRFNVKEKKKFAIVMVGGPGSGKSSGRDRTLAILQMELRDFVVIDPDEILSTLYKNNNNCRPAVNNLNDVSFMRAYQENYNIIFDGTGKDYKWYTENVVGLLKKKGYIIYLTIVTNKLETVLPRIKDRAEKTNRDVDVKYTTDVYNILNDIIPKYLELKCTDVNGGIFVFDNSGKELKLMLKTSCDNEQKIIEKCKFSYCRNVGGKKSKKKKSKKKLQKKKSKKKKSKKKKLQKKKSKKKKSKKKLQKKKSKKKK